MKKFKLFILSTILVLSLLTATACSFNLPSLGGGSGSGSGAGEGEGGGSSTPPANSPVITQVEGTQGLTYKIEKIIDELKTNGKYSITKSEKDSISKEFYANYCEEEECFETIEDFFEEYTLGRFVNGNRVAFKDLKDCSEKDCFYCKQGKCWNANNTHMCKVRKGSE